jgi:glycosyltransferase involved in cell wall biosynthesis
MTETARRVLVVAYYFPPMGLSGVQRTVKFVKYLPQFGWQPTVLTVEPTGYFAVDYSLQREVESAGVRIVRTDSFDPNRLFRRKGIVKMPSEGVRKLLQFAGDTFFIPDTKVGWKSKAVRAALELTKQEPFDLIFTTAPPQTDFLIGAELKRRTGLPLVLDYRDAWIDYPFKYHPTPLHRYLHYRLEKRVLHTADRIIVTQRRIKESILKRHRFLHYHDVMLLPQGFDPDDLEGHAPLSKKGAKKLIVAHAGTFYGGRNPRPLLHGLAKLFADIPPLRGRIELCFIGNHREEDARLVRDLGLQNDVVFTGYLDHRECVRTLLSSDVLYLVLDNDYQSPGKLYEYFGTRKPILASVVDGYMKQTINESGAATLVPLGDATAHADALRELFARYEHKKLPAVSEEFAAQYNRRLLTAELARQFEALMDHDSHPIVKVEERAA